jgi:hypothetical protein
MTPKSGHSSFYLGTHYKRKSTTLYIAQKNYFSSSGPVPHCERPHTGFHLDHEPTSADVQRARKLLGEAA